MRTSAVAAILAITIVPVSLCTGDDFSALLADLSFGDVAPVETAKESVETAKESLTVAQEKTVAELKPVPTGIMMPEMIESAAQEVAAPESTANAAPEVDPEAGQSPQVALQDPIPATVPEASQLVDLEAAFALEGVQSAQSAIPTQVVGHHRHHKCQPACDPIVTCRPHNKVNLPSSTFMQYFRSNACNTNVWDGYQQKCRCCNKHLDGRCDCFDKRGKSGCGCASGGCCDAGCDG